MLYFKNNLLIKKKKKFRSLCYLVLATTSRSIIYFELSKEEIIYPKKRLTKGNHLTIRKPFIKENHLSKEVHCNLSMGTNYRKNHLCQNLEKKKYQFLNLIIVKKVESFWMWVKSKWGDLVQNVVRFADKKNWVWQWYMYPRVTISLPVIG